MARASRPCEATAKMAVPRRDSAVNLKGVWLLLIAILVLALTPVMGRTDAGPRRQVSPAAAILSAPPAAGGQGEQSETRELIFKTINFVILVGALAYLLRKPLSDFFTQRSAEIETGLAEGRKALAEAEARLSAVEEKLRRLGEEISEFKAAAEREMDAGRQRMREAAEAEAQKVLESARARMDTMARAAQLDLRRYVAGEALKQAEETIRGRLDDAGHRRLVSRFVDGLGARN